MPAHDRLDQMADDRVQDDQPMRRDPEREPYMHHTSQPQWCPGGLTRSQKRRVQRLCQLEIIEEEQEQTPSKKGVRSQVWRVKPKADDEQDPESLAASVNMISVVSQRPTLIQAVGSLNGY